MLAAKQQDPSLPIDANGKWTGGEKILTIATNADPGKKTAEVFQGQIEKLGLQAELPHRAAGHAVHEVLRRAARRRSRSARTSGWFKDFADPQSMLDADVQRQQHPPAGQRQLAAAQRPGDQRRHEGRPRSMPVGPERNKAWAKINHMIAEQAPAIPWIWDKTALVELQGRRRRGQRLLHDPRPQLHLAEVGGREGRENHT